MTWYITPAKTDTEDIDLERIPDFGAFVPSQKYYVFQVDYNTFYVLSEETMPFPSPTTTQLLDQGLDPNRSITGA